MKKVLSLIGLCALSLHVAAAHAQSPGSSAVPFLLITPGARASGMGESFVSIADDATATYWNPAGMAFHTGTKVALMHAKWLPQLADDLYYEYATATHPIKDLGTVGFSITYISLGLQSITGEDSPEVLGTFSSNEFALAGSFATKVGANNSVGVVLKLIRSNLAPELDNTTQKGDGSGTSFAVDLGYLHKNLLLDRLNLGVNLTNVGPKITYIDAAQADPLPTNLRLGLSYELIKQEYNTLIIGTEINRLLVAQGDDGKALPVYQAIFKAWGDEPLSEEMKHIIYNAGAEYWYNNFVALRAGYHYDRDGRVKYVTFGAGLKYSSLNLDFGYVSAGEGHPLSDTMRFSLGLNLGKNTNTSNN